MRDFQEALPGLDTIFYGDKSHCPYGEKDGWEIQSLTLKGVEFLVSKWATIIILACNTAAAHAIRYLQNEVYPRGSGIQILGVTVPWAEEVVNRKARHVGVFATKATVQAKVYTERIHLLDSWISVQEIPFPGLVDAIEDQKRHFHEIEHLLQEWIKSLDERTESIILGCTHYPLVAPAIETALMNRFHRPIPIIDPAKIAAEKFVSYLKRHPEFSLSFNGKSEIYWG